MSYRNNARTCVIIGAILALVGSIITLVGVIGGHNPQVEAIVGPIVVIVISVLIFIAIGVLHSRKVTIPFNAWIMVVFVVLEVFLSGAALFSITGIGIILEVIGTTLLFVSGD